MPYQKNIREEELKKHVARDFFSEYDTTHIIGNVDFCVAPSFEQGYLFDMNYADSDHFESLLWAEAKRGKKSEQEMYKSLVQLILTIGKERTIEQYMPPLFLGAFDAEKIVFIPYEKVMDVFSQNDFDWTVAPSNHESKEFLQLFNLVVKILENETLYFCFDDKKELKNFIHKNLQIGNQDINRIQVTKNNFVNIYTKWVIAVKPTINLNWEYAKSYGILDADFFLADLLSEENTTIIEKLYVLLKNKQYELDRKIDDLGFEESKKVAFNDKQKAHKQFWSRYSRPPKEEYWSYIVERRDLLVPQDVRERKGSYFTPKIWVEKSQEYIADCLGENWQDEYYIWDNCAGTGNLLVGLTNKRNVWASTIDQADVDVMKERIQNGANLFEDHVFKFDFLNDSFDKLPPELKEIIDDEEKRKKLVIYINPPYAEASDKKTYKEGTQGKRAVEQSLTNKRYASKLGQANAELFAQFFIRIHEEIGECKLAEFSKLKHVQGPHFSDFRNNFQAKLMKMFMVPANTFDNVTGKFPIGFFVWDCSVKEVFKKCHTDIFDAQGFYLGTKKIVAYDNSEFINEWIKPYRAQKESSRLIGKFPFKGNDFQNQNMIALVNPETVYNKEAGQFLIDSQNVAIACVYLAVRHCIPATWQNDRDQFLGPKDSWANDLEFQSDCLAFVLFNKQNSISCDGQLSNHWIPFTEEQVGCKSSFRSHFMSDFIAGKIQRSNTSLFLNSIDQDILNGTKPVVFSLEVQAVMCSGLELWTYYHQQPHVKANASFYDVRGYFQGFKNGKMNAKSADDHYNQMIANLRQKMKILARKIEAKVYEYGFLKS
ncbi:MAG: hypothetical protein HUK21_05290 [Fibrobacteraceae bacterium]|nr:hypothetical protein [Fibrobacteraceae bacterium]